MGVLAWPIGIRAREPLTPVLWGTLGCQGFLSKILANNVKAMPGPHTMRRWVLRKETEASAVVPASRVAPHPSGRGWDSKPCY